VLIRYRRIKVQSEWAQDFLPEPASEQATNGQLLVVLEKGLLAIAQ
jgi:hypothetical protein